MNEALKAIDEALKKIDDIFVMISGAHCDCPTHRETYALTLYDVTIEHARAIAFMLRHDPNFGISAYALVRPMIEKYARAGWLMHCATDEKAQLILDKDRDKDWPNLREMLSQTIEKNGCPPEVLEIWNRVKNNCHSFTHGGAQLYARRFDGERIGQIITPEEIKQMAEGAWVFASWSAEQIAKTLVADDVKEKLIELCNS